MGIYIDCRDASHRPAIFIGTIVLVAASFYFIGTISVELAPQSDANEISVDMEMAEGMNIAVVRQYLNELAEAVKAELPMDQ